MRATSLAFYAMQHALSLPSLGFGLGLRAKHYPYIFENEPAVDWFEIISENFMDTDGKPKRNLARIRERYPVVMHGVSLSIGTANPLQSDYLNQLKKLIDWLKPAWVSDHLCWTGVAHKNTHDLLPVPYTEESLKHLVQRIREVQDFLERPIALENPSTYLEFSHSDMPEAEFIARMAEDSGCHLLLDVNNVYVTCYNHRLDAGRYLDTLPLHRVIQIHLSGHSNKGTHIIDTHDAPVIDDVWQLYRYVVHRAGRIPNTMIEWDDKIPEFPVLLNELNKAKEAAATAAHYQIPDLAREALPQRSNTPQTLEAAQLRMQEAILRGHDFDSEPALWIRTKEAFLPHEQLAVYVNAFRYRLFDVVAEDYPALKAHLGSKAFESLIDAFIENTPPSHYNIARYALELAPFVERHLPEDAFAHDLCILETSIAQLADPEETPVLEQQHLEGLTPERFMQVRLYPRIALKLLAFRYPVTRFYRQVMDDKPAQKPARKASYAAVFRHQDIVWRMDLEATEYRLLRALFDGKTISEALDGLKASQAASLTRYFSRWMRNGLLAATDYNTNPPKEDIYHEAA